MSPCPRVDRIPLEVSPHLSGRGSPARGPLSCLGSSSHQVGPSGYRGRHRLVAPDSPSCMESDVSFSGCDFRACVYPTCHSIRRMCGGEVLLTRKSLSSRLAAPRERATPAELWYLAIHIALLCNYDAPHATPNVRCVSAHATNVGQGKE